MNTAKKLVSIAMTTAAMAAPGLLQPTSAQAAARDGNCESGEFCYYYNSDFAGSVSDFTSSVADYGATQPGCYEFKGAGAGQYQCIKNNAASAWNRSGQTVRVYYNSNFGGTYQDFAPGARLNLVAALKNNNASHQFITQPPPPSDSYGRAISRSEVLSRSAYWVNLAVPYSQSATYRDSDGNHTYRTDCSGFVSMAWHANPSGQGTYWTGSLPSISSQIGKADLQPGDILLNVSSHVVLFVGWADAGHTSYIGREETGSHGTIQRTIPYPYFSGYGTYLPYRYNLIR